MSSVDDAPAVPKIEPFEDDDFSESTPEPDDLNNTQEVAQVQKRKGGRKPIYATSEERKQRNRQAQAAFRERRTEYIKQLEATIKHHEDSLQSLQQSHRSAADECLMLRYKNSLLERILLEKGIDVQAELSTKTEGSHVLSHPPSSAAIQPSPVQRHVFNRHQVRRPVPGPVSKALRPQYGAPNHPPRLQPTPPASAISPDIKSPRNPSTSSRMPSSSDPSNQPRHSQPIHPRTHTQQPASGQGIPGPGPGMHSIAPGSADDSRSNNIRNVAGGQTSYSQSLFQSHIAQLEQEYDAHTELLDDDDPSDSSAGPGPYPQPYHQQPLAPGQPMSLSIPGQPPMHHLQSMQLLQPMRPTHSTQNIDANSHAFGVMNPGFDPYDPNLDADPFGLTASMHFPTQFTFQESSLRR